MSYATLLIALLALVVSIWVALTQRRLSMHANALPLVVDMFQEYRSPPFIHAREMVMVELHRYSPDLGFSSLPDDIRGAVQTVSYFFDNVGVIVLYGLVDPRLVSAFAGGAVIRTWDTLEPFIDGEGKRRQIGSFQVNFRNLAKLMREYSPDEVRKKLPNWCLRADDFPAPSDNAGSGHPSGR